MAEVDERWVNVRLGPRKLTEREAHELAAPWHNRWLGAYKDNPSSQTAWRVDLGDRLFAPPPRVPKFDIDIFEPLDPDVSAIMDMEASCGDCAKETLQWRGLAESSENIDLVARTIRHAIQRASLTLARYARGDFGTGISSQIRPGLNHSPRKSVAELRHGYSHHVNGLRVSLAGSLVRNRILFT